MAGLEAWRGLTAWKFDLFCIPKCMFVGWFVVVMVFFFCLTPSPFTKSNSQKRGKLKLQSHPLQPPYRMHFSPTYPNCCFEFKFLLCPLEMLMKMCAFALPCMSYELYFFLKKPQNRQEFCKLHYKVNINWMENVGSFGGLQLLYVFVRVPLKSSAGPLARKLPICLVTAPALGAIRIANPSCFDCLCLLLNAN